jgi:hypothetical protein
MEERLSEKRIYFLIPSDFPGEAPGSKSRRGDRLLLFCLQMKLSHRQSASNPFLACALPYALTAPRNE